MPRKPDDDRLAALIARRNRTDAAIRRIRTKNEKTARAEETRRKVIAGALALEHAARNPGSDFARIMVRLLDEYARPQDRRLFADLLPGGSPAPDGENLTADEMRAIAPEAFPDTAAQ